MNHIMTLVFVCSSKINVLIHTKIFIQKILLSDVLSENRYVAVVEKVFAWVNMSPWYHCFIRSPDFTLYDQTGWPRSQAGVFLWSHYDSIHQPEIVRSFFTWPLNRILIRGLCNLDTKSNSRKCSFQFAWFDWYIFDEFLTWYNRLNFKGPSLTWNRKNIFHRNFPFFTSSFLIRS